MHTHVRVAGVDLLADVFGALFLEGDRILLVADLHLEKGSSFARRGMMLPPYDTAATLAKLTAVGGAHPAPRGDRARRQFPRPRMARSASACLGPRRAGPPAGRPRLDLARRQSRPPAPPDGLGGTTAGEWKLGALTLRHEPAPGAVSGEIAGHLHPVAIVMGTSGAVRRRCFVSDGTRCIMPAFGAYAGRPQLPPPGLRRSLDGGPPHRLMRSAATGSMRSPKHRCLTGRVIRCPRGVQVRRYKRSALRESSRAFSSSLVPDQKVVRRRDPASEVCR